MRSFDPTALTARMPTVVLQRRSRKYLLLLALMFLSAGNVTSADGQTPPDDPYLGVPILSAGAPTPGGAMHIENHDVIAATGAGVNGITASSTTGGYAADTLNRIRNFSDAPFSYVTTGVRNADGSAGTLGQPVNGTLVDADGRALAGDGGTFTLTADGRFQFVADAAFGSLVDALPPDQSLRTSVAFTVTGTNTENGATKDSSGTLIVTVTRNGDGTLTQGIAAEYDNDFGSTHKPETDGTVFPDLKSFVTGLLRFSYRGGPGSAVTIVNDGTITTAGTEADGINVITRGQNGSDGADARLLHSSTPGTGGGAGGAITVEANGTIATCAETRTGCVGFDRSVGVLAWSVGGNGGTGGDSGYTRRASAGGPGADGATVTVTGNGTIRTGGAQSSGILAVSQGGDGGAGGGGSTFRGAANGANGGAGGTVSVLGSWNIETWGQDSHGIFAKSLGGVAGSGGNGGWTGTSSGGGGLGTWGGSVTVYSDGTIKTHGDASHGIYAWSAGGHGGAGGSGTSIFYASGGNGSAAGSGGPVNVTNGANGWIETWGVGSHGLFAQSIGGGGGSGGSGEALVGFGGSSESGGDGGLVSVVNAGTITAHGASSKGIYAQSIGGGGGDGGVSYGMVAFGGQGSKTSNGGNVTVLNAGTIATTGDAIFAQSIGGAGGNGGSSGGWFSFGGSGGGGGNAGTVTISSHGDLTTTGFMAHALFGESLGGGGGNGGNSVAVGLITSVSIGGSAGSGGTGADVFVGVDPMSSAVDPVTGVLTTIGDSSNGIFAQSQGGGGGNGGFAVSVAAGVGGSLAVGIGGDGGGGNGAAASTVYFGDAESRITTKGSYSNGILAHSVGGGGGTGGFSIAASLAKEFAASVSLGGTGGTGGHSGAVTVGSDAHPILGNITTTGAQSYGILAQSQGGGGGAGGMSIAAGAALIGVDFAMGGTGGGGGTASTVDLINASSVTTSGRDSLGLFAQSVGGGGGAGGFSIAAGVALTGNVNVTLGGTGGDGGDGDVVTLANSGAITTSGPRSSAIVAQSVGGGGGHGGFAIGAGISQFSANIAIGGDGGGGGTGGDVVVTNSGAVTTRGTSSHGLMAQSIGGGGGSGGFALDGSVTTAGAFDFALGGKGNTGGSSGAVTVTNTGAISTGNNGAGAGSYGIFAQSTGGGGGVGGFGGAFSLQFSGSGSNASFAVGVGGNGGDAGNGGTVTVVNGGVVQTTAPASTGLFAQSIGGGGGDGGFGLSVSLAASAGSNASAGVAIGGSAGGGGDGEWVSVTNTGSITTGGSHSPGILAQSVGGGGGNGGASVSLVGSMGFNSSNSASVSVGGSGGLGGDGSRVSLTNNGRIETTGDESIAIQAQSIGGGGGAGGLALSASLAGPPARTFSVSVGGTGGDGGIGAQVDVTGSGGSVVTHGRQSYGIEAQSIGGGGGNGGTSVALAFGAGDFSHTSATISAAVGGTGGVGNTGGLVNVGTTEVPLEGSIRTEGEDAIGILAQSIGGGGGSGGSSVSGSLTVMPGRTGPNLDLSLAAGGHGGTGNDGGQVLVNETGDIDTWGAGSHGIEAQSIGGGGGNGGTARALTLQLAPALTNQATKNFTVTASVGGSGAGGGDGGILTVTHDGAITTRGAGAYGIFAQSIGGGGGIGGDGRLGSPTLVDDAANFAFGQSSFLKSVKFTVGGSEGAFGNGRLVSVANSGSITTYGDGSTAVVAQSIGGGGGIAGGGTADPGLGLGLLTLAAGGGGGAGGDGGEVRVALAGGVATSGRGAIGVFAQSVGGGGGVAGGVDRGVSSFENIGWGPGLGQDGGNGGNGGLVTVTSTADIFTRGHSSTGIFAQSVGGGGGVVGGMGHNLLSLQPLNFYGSVGAKGAGGIVSVTQSGNITTLGDSADGIFAQSAGGLVDEAGAGGRGGNVTVTLTTGSIRATGNGSSGIFAQSRGQGGNGNVSVSILNPASIIVGGSEGAAIRIADGNHNTVTNYGTLTTVDGVGGTAILGGAGHDNVTNFGTVVGSIDLAGGVNSFTNAAGAWFLAGDRVNVGAGNVFLNAGTLSLGDVGQRQTTAVIGNFVQSGTPRWMVDIGEIGQSDALVVSGAAQLGTSVTTVDLHEIQVPSATGEYALLSASGGVSGGAFRFGTMYGEMPLGRTFGFATSETQQTLTLLPSAGPFRWAGAVGGDWTTPFVNGTSNWSRTGASDYIFGTPGRGSDVTIANSGHSSMGADFTINSLSFSGGVSHTLADAHTLTLVGIGAPALSVDGSAVVGVNLVLGGSQSWWISGSLVVNGAGVGGSGSDLTVDGPGTTFIYSPIRTGAGSVTKTGSGLLVLRGANTYRGGTNVSGGILVGDTVGLQGDIVNDAEVVFDQAAEGAFSGNITGVGWVVKQNDGALRMNGTNTYTGGTLVVGGALVGDTKSVQGFIQNDATVVFDQEVDGAYGGTMNGAGMFVKQNRGALTITGNSSGFGGRTVVSGGRLVVDGWLGGSALVVQSGAVLGGSGHVTNSTIENGAVLSPTHVLTVVGDLRLEQGATYRVGTEAYGSSDVTLVSGQTWVNGATLEVEAGGARRYRPINVYRVLAGADIIGSFAGVTTNLAYLNSSLQYSADAVGLTLRRNDVDFRTVGTSGNQTSVALALNALVSTATGTFASVVNTVYDLPDERARQSMSSMSGVLYQYTARAGLDLSRGFASSGLRRLGFAAGALEIAHPNAHFGATDPVIQPAPFAGAQYGLWVNGLGAGTRYWGSEADAPAAVQAGGIMGGFDAAVSRSVSLGVSLGRGWPTIALDGVPDRSTSTLTGASAYGRFASGNTRVDGAFGLTRIDTSSSRAVTDGVATLVARSSNRGTGLALQADYGYSVGVATWLRVEPSVGVQIGRLDLDGFTETGGDVLSLDVPARSVQSRRVLPGARLAFAAGRSVGIDVRSAWAHEFQPLEYAMVRFAGDPAANVFAIAPANDARNSAVVGVTLDAAFGSSIRLFTDVGGEFGGVGRIWSGTFGFRSTW